jgi:hypothetical protein
MAGRRDPSEYTFVVAEVSWDPRKKEGRLNTIAGEVFPQDMYIECSKGRCCPNQPLGHNFPCPR